MDTKKVQKNVQKDLPWNSSIDVSTSYFSKYSIRGRSVRLEDDLYDQVLIRCAKWFFESPTKINFFSELKDDLCELPLTYQATGIIFAFCLFIIFAKTIEFSFSFFLLF